jgi:CheY-like chemotaxis protein
MAKQGTQCCESQLTMSKRILVIDDDEATQELFKFFLTDEGWEVYSYDYAHTNPEVVQHLTPDLIILDLNLAQSGIGWSFLQLLKMEDTTAAIPVVICTTAPTLTHEIEGYLASRHISVIRKPFDIDDFIVTIRKNFTSEPVLPILVVEDNEDIAENVMTFLEFSGYIVEVVTNGLLALDAVAKGQYALILLDISMPVMNGFEFLAAYAQQPGLHCSVIILSAEADLKLEPLPDFVMAVLPKPYELHDLLNAVSQYTHPVSGEVGR